MIESAAAFAFEANSCEPLDLRIGCSISVVLMNWCECGRTREVGEVVGWGMLLGRGLR